MNPIHCFQYFVFSVCVHFLTIFVYVIYYSDFLMSTYSNEVLAEYDYIIVGAGTAGSLIAHRIGKETKFTYIVLEAGAHGNSLLDIPVLGPLLHGSIYDWQFETVPQEHGCFAMKDKKCHLPQGKIVGGSSKLNNMVHIRGNLSHYVEWFRGKYTEEYIQKQLEYVEKEIMHLDEIKYQSKLTEAILEAALELSYKQYDVSSRFGKGFMRSKVSQKNGKRWVVSDKVDSQHLITNAFIERVIIDNDNVARGVVFHQNGKIGKVTAKKAVILSAGTFNTPKILQLSGVGPSEVLKPLNIPTLVDLPVGNNLQDHVTTGLDLITFYTSLNIGPGDMLNPVNIFKYYFQGRGPLTTPGCEVVGFLSTENNSVPNLQFMVLPVGIASDKGAQLKQNIGITDEVWNKYFTKSFDRYTATILPILLHPKSKGEVRIISKDPFKLPLVDPKYLSAEEDLEVLIEGLKLVMEFVNTGAMKNLGAHLNPNHFPGCENYEIFSNEYWGCYVKHLTLTSYHPVGTCAMGSVVDLYFQVIGVKSLFICDGSVLPTLPSGNINAAIAMMANIFFEINIPDVKDNSDNYTCRKNIFEDIYQVCLKDH